MDRHSPHNEGVNKEKMPSILILCGGLGTRLQSVIPDRPKILAPIGDRTFLDVLLEWVRRQGFFHIIFCVGYRAVDIRNHLTKATFPIIFSEENEPLGTGGAIKKALPLAEGDDCIIMNGDTLCDIDLKDFVRFHRSHNAPMSMVLSPSSRTDGGGVALESGGRIVSFEEKAGKTETRYLSAGVYIFGKQIASTMPSQGMFSLELDFFPSLIKRFPCFGYVTAQEAIDIGTPERYYKALRDFGPND